MTIVRFEKVKDSKHELDKINHRSLIDCGIEATSKYLFGHSGGIFEELYDINLSIAVLRFEEEKM